MSQTCSCTSLWPVVPYGDKDLGQHAWQNKANIKKFSFQNGHLTGRCNCNFKSVIFKLILKIDILSTSHEIACKWMPKEPTNDRSTLVQVMTVPNNPLPEPMLIRSHNGLLQSATIQPFTLNLLANTCPVIWIFPLLENYSSKISFLPGANEGWVKRQAFSYVFSWNCFLFW